MNVSNDVIENVIIDWRKKDITLEEKSLLVKAYLKESGLSERALANKLGIKRSTLNDWVSKRQATKVRTNLDSTSARDIDYLCDRLIFLLSRPFKSTSRTLERIQRLKSELDKFELQIVED